MSQRNMLQQSTNTSFDPSLGAAQVGFREIYGDIPLMSERISLLAWAIVFLNTDEAMERYDHIVHLLVNVGADARIREPIAGVQGETFGSMSERTDLLGDVSTIWVTSLTGTNNERGAVLASTSGVLVQILATDLYVATGIARGIYLLEEVAERMAARERDLVLPPESDTMSRLPIVTDLYGLLENASIRLNRYTSLHRN